MSATFSEASSPRRAAIANPSRRITASRCPAGVAHGLQDDVTAIATGTLPTGTQIGVERSGALLSYTIANDQATHVIAGNPWLASHDKEHRQAGVNLAAWALEELRAPSVIQRARDTPYPRLTALLDAIGTAPSDTDAAGNWYFHLPADGGTTQRLSLEEIPLPGAPPALT